MNTVPFDRHRPAATKSLRYVLVAVVLGALNLALRFPGESNPDSDDQYQQLLSGRYTDWHPPVMARLWRVLHVFGDGTGPIFAFHIAAYWIGFALVSVALARRGRPLAAWCVLAVGALPPLLMLNINIAKDIGLGAALLCAFGLCYLTMAPARSGDADRSVPGWAMVSSLLLIAYAALVRGNAVFAVGPLIVYAVARRSPKHPLRTCIVAAIAAAVVLIPVSSIVNRFVLRAAPGGALESLQFFDVAGTARLADDSAAFGPADPGADLLGRCYSPIMWDTLPQRCPDLWAAVRGPVLGGTAGTGAQPSLSTLWLHAMAAHPLAYLEHRLLTFNATLYLYVPPHHTEFVRKIDTAGNRSPSLSHRLLDAVRYNWLTAPATLFVLGCALLVVAVRSRAIAAGERDAALVLLTSATIYTLSFLPFGVATDQRYFFWPSIAVLVAAIIVAPSFRTQRRWDVARLSSTLVPVLLVLLVIAIARLGDDPTLLLLQR